jgi:hypothetical protein
MSQEIVWCAKCHLRIAPFDRRTVYQKVDYHQQCFLKLVRDEAEQQRAARNTEHRQRVDSMTGVGR